MRRELETEILLLISGNRTRAFEMTFEACWMPLYRQAYRKVQSEEIAKDLVQDAFVSFWDKMESLDEETKLQAYLFAILRNKILKLFERDEVRLRHAMRLAMPEEQPADATVHQLLVDKELNDMVREEVDRMPSRMKEIYELKKEQDLSVKEIAAALGLSEQTIKNQLHSAYQRLRLRLKDYDSSLVVATAVFLKIF